MDPKTGMPSASVIHVAQSDASQSVSKWGWTAFGVALSIVPMVNIFLLGISAVVVSVLTPNMDLSSSKRLEFYFQNPACYTAEYRKTAKRLRCMRTLYGWLTGVIIISFFF
jgi:hypothetical protein